MIFGDTLSKILSIVNKILAFAVLLAYALFAINMNWPFITNDTLISIIKGVMYYGPLAICGMVMIEFAIKRNIIIQLVVYAIIAIAIIFQFFPETLDAIFSIAK